MKKILLIAIAMLIAGSCLVDQRAEAGNPFNGWAQRRADQEPWHGNYYYLPYGQPTALVVPPNVHMRQTYSWGVSQNLMYPLKPSIWAQRNITRRTSARIVPADSALAKSHGPIRCLLRSRTLVTADTASVSSRERFRQARPGGATSDWWSALCGWKDAVLRLRRSCRSSI
jgi:hypothetical protein